MVKQLLGLLVPFSVIARELTALRELYEAELASRPTPIYRVTEAPSRGDTEVTFTSDQDKVKPSAIKRLLFGDEGEDDEEHNED